MLIVLLSMIFPGQVPVVVVQADQYLTRENTCYEFQIWYQGHDATNDSAIVIEDRHAIYNAMRVFFPDPCQQTVRNLRHENKLKQFEIFGQFFVSEDGKNITKFQITVRQRKEDKNLLSLVGKVPDDPPVPRHVSLKQAIIEAYIDFLQKLPRSRACP